MKSTKWHLNEVSFGSVTIQKLRRITLDQNLLRTLGLEEGDLIDVALIVDTGEIRLRKCEPTETVAARKHRQSP